MADTENCVVIGAGPAGVRAAEILLKAGIRPIVIDEGRTSGGQIYRRQARTLERGYRTLYGFEAGRAASLHRTADRVLAQCDYRPGTLVWGIFENQLHLLTDGVSDTLPFSRLVIATGATDRLLPLPGWTIPGTYSLGGSQIALKAQACAVGDPVVFMGTGPLLYLVAYQYAKAGVTVAGVLDTSPRRLTGISDLVARPSTFAKGLYYLASLRRMGIRVETGVTLLAVEGEAHVTGARFRDAGGRETTIACNAVGMGYHLRAETQLADLARCTFVYNRQHRQWLPLSDEDGRSSESGVYLAGDCTGLLGADGAEIAGRLAAYAVLRDLGRDVPERAVRSLRRAQARMARFQRGIARAFPLPVRQLSVLPDETLLCRCEAITVGTLRERLAQKQAPEVNRAKALTRVGMGRCQGRFCGIASAELTAMLLDKDVAEVGRLRGQAPVKQLPLSTVGETTR